MAVALVLVYIAMLLVLLLIALLCHLTLFITIYPHSRSCYLSKHTHNPTPP